MCLYRKIIFICFVISASITFAENSLRISSGSYQKTSTECHLFTPDNSSSIKLGCQCRIEESSYMADSTLGSMRFPTIDPEDCEDGDIANSDGRLESPFDFIKDGKHSIKDKDFEMLCWAALALYAGGMAITIQLKVAAALAYRFLRCRQTILLSPASPAA